MLARTCLCVCLLSSAFCLYASCIVKIIWECTSVLLIICVHERKTNQNDGELGTLNICMWSCVPHSPHIYKRAVLTHSLGIFAFLLAPHLLVNIERNAIFSIVRRQFDRLNRYTFSSHHYLRFSALFFLSAHIICCIFWLNRRAFCHANSAYWH